MLNKTATLLTLIRKKKEKILITNTERDWKKMRKKPPSRLHLESRLNLRHNNPSSPVKQVLQNTKISIIIPVLLPMIKLI